MPTKRLVLLLLLVAVAGGCSIWYTKMILPAGDVVSDTEVSVPSVVADTSETETPVVATKPKVTAPAEPSLLDKVSDAIGASALADDLAAIAESADAVYDDSVLQAQLTSSEPASLTTAYDI
jgi:hypothetical protein